YTSRHHYIHRPLVPLYLHSIPTRRSSDLCGFPGLLPHTHMTPTQRRNLYQEGEIVTYICNQYPKIYQKPLTRTCTHGAWTESVRSEEHTSELQSLAYLVCFLLLEKKITLN